MRSSEAIRNHPRVKVCCIQSAAEARLAISYGAAAIGLVSSMPSGPGVISEELIREIAEGVPPGVATVLLTSSQNVDAIIAQQRRCCVNAIQLCDELPAETVAELRARLPGIAIIQVIHVVDERALAQSQTAAKVATALLLDSGNPGKPVKELGGTGRTHDWRLSREICDTVSIPVFLAGGLNPANIAAAVQQVRSYGVDVCSGLRAGGHLSEPTLAAFFRNLDRGWQVAREALVGDG
jgi:phosphoribosylanthranilate isomerase